MRFGYWRILSAVTGVLLALGALIWADPGYTSPTVREASREAVSDCFARTAPGTRKVVTRDMRMLCRKNPSAPSLDIYQGDRIEYEIVRGDSGFTLKADVPLDVQPARATAARKRSILEMTQACLPTINQYWKRYGIELDFSFSLLQGRAADHANTVVVTDAPGRSNSRNFYYQGLDNDITLPGGQVLHGGPGRACVRQLCPLTGLSGQSCADACEPAREKEYCQMLVHELGHRLGLPDEYADPMCPDREFVSTETQPWSIMAVPFAGIFDMPSLLPGSDAPGLDSGMAEFFPRHMDEVLAPVCGR